MTLARRTFLGSATAAVIAGVTAPMLTSNAEAAGPSASTTRATFVPLLGQTLRVTAAGQRRSLRLAAVTDVVGAPAGSAESFVLRFTSSSSLSDGVHSLALPGGAVGLFISGVDRGSSRSYEAVVNRSEAQRS